MKIPRLSHDLCIGVCLCAALLYPSAGLHASEPSDNDAPETSVFGFEVWPGLIRSELNQRFLFSLNLILGESDGSDILEIGGIGNMSNSHSGGVQVAGLANYASAVTGLQVAGAFNLAHDVAGAQMGFVNMASNVAGVQLGVLNVARAARGVQFGLVNIADEADVGVGLVNIAEQNAMEIEAAVGELGLATIGLRHEASALYNLYFVGTRRTRTYLSDYHLVVGLGIGWRTPMSADFEFSLDTTTNLFVIPISQGVEIIALQRLRPLVAWQLAEHFALFAGPTLAVQFDAGNGDIYVPSTAWWAVSDAVAIWPGFTLGGRFIF